MLRPLDVLVVEDEDDHYDLVTRTLLALERGVSSTRATTLGEALRLLRGEHGFDAVLLDLGLPDVPEADPLQVLRAVLDVPSCPAVLVVTARPAELGALAVRIGAEDYIAKGEIRAPNLGHTLEQSVERHARVGALAVQHRRLLQLNAQLRNVAATVAHDLRSPLATAITGLLTLRENGDLLGDEERADILDRSVQRLTGLAEQVAEMLGSAVERGTGDREEIDLAAAVAWARELADDDQGRLQVELAPGAARTLWGSLTALRQVLLNLFINALEHNPGRCVRVTVDLRGSGPYTELVVTDDGAGFPDGIDVFEVGASTRERGSGLGLPTVQLQAELSGGAVHRLDPPGGGAGIVVVLPQRSAGRRGSPVTAAVAAD